MRGSGGGQQVAASQAGISPPPSDQRGLPGELRVPPASVVLPGHPWLCRQPAAAALQLGTRSGVSAHPTSCLPCCHGRGDVSGR